MGTKFVQKSAQPEKPLGGLGSVGISSGICYNGLVSVFSQEIGGN
jgi:hypothetical protein